MELHATFLALFLSYTTFGLALRAATVPADTKQALQQKVRNAFFGMGGLTPEQADGRGEAQEDGNSQQPGGVAMQMTDEELERFSGSLSDDCKAQFEAMLRGEGSGIHTYQGLLQQRRNESRVENAAKASNTSDASKAVNPYAGMSDSEASCAKLDGGLCLTRAFVEQAANQGGRSMRSRVDVDGNGCLPKQCMAQRDLQAWADFMRGKAKENLPGADTTMELHVNCSLNGGGVVQSGPEAPAA